MVDEDDRTEETKDQVGGRNNCQEAETAGTQQKLDSSERNASINGKTVRGHSMAKDVDESGGEKEDQQKKATNYQNGNKVAQEDENVSKEMEDQEENYGIRKIDEKECQKEENVIEKSDENDGQKDEDLVKRSDEQDGEKQENVIKGGDEMDGQKEEDVIKRGDEMDGQKEEDVIKGSDEMDGQKEEDVIKGSDEMDGQKEEDVIKRSNEKDGQKEEDVIKGSEMDGQKEEDVIKGGDEMDGQKEEDVIKGSNEIDDQKEEDVIKGSDEMDGQKEEGVIDRCAGQQHDSDRGKENANRIPNPEEVITSERRKVRLKDILRSCVAQVKCPYIIYYFLFFGLQEFLTYLFTKRRGKD